MKSKGKGLRTDSKKSDDDATFFPDFKSVDHGRFCPRYTTVLQRTEDEGIGEDELDTLQLELENLLSNVSKRMRLLESETQSLNNWPDNGDVRTVLSGSKKDQSSSSSSSSSKSGGGKLSSVADREAEISKLVASGSPGKRGKLASSVDEKPCKRSKGSPCPPASIPVAPAPPPPPPPPPPVPVVPQNETPNKFWTLIEPFCAEITNADTKFVEDAIKSIEQDDDWKTIIPGEQWDDSRRNGEDADKLKGDSNGDSTSTTTKPLALQRAEIVDFENSDFGLGPVTSLLVGALVSTENSAECAADALLHGGESLSGDSSISPNVLAKNLGLGNMHQLERRIKRELFELGVLDEADMDGKDGTHSGSGTPTKQSAKSEAEEGVDEVTREMRRIQAELAQVSEQNLKTLNSLLKKAQDEMAKQELRKKLGHADNEVMECYRKMQECHHKKRPPTKKEKDMAIRAVAQRELVVRQLEKYDY